MAVLFPGTQAAFRSRTDAFRAELKRLGYVEGRDLSLEMRWPEDSIERLNSIAGDLVSLKPAVIVTAGSAGVIACKKATSTIPIVFATVLNPVEQGFVASLQRPGGNITGVMVHLAIAAKIVEVIREALPEARRLGIFVHETDPARGRTLEAFLPSAQRFEFEPVVVGVTAAREIERAFGELVSRKVDALYLADLAFNTTHREELVARSLKARLPLFSAYPEITVIGGLLSYGNSREENYRRAAVFVDKILRGANPAELAVEQPERFELFVNRRTAKAIGVTLSPLTMLRADKVID